jgi:hypothetical protein
MLELVRIIPNLLGENQPQIFANLQLAKIWGLYFILEYDIIFRKIHLRKEIIMKKLILAMGATALALTGLANSKTNAFVGNWGLRLPYNVMNAGHIVVSQNDKGGTEGLLLWRWASPFKVSKVQVKGDDVTITFHKKMKIVGKVSGESFKGKVYNGNKIEGDILGWRNPQIKSGVKMSDAVYGEKIDLLKGGLNGWKNFGGGKKFGWKFKDGVLSNLIGKNKKGRWAGGGVNLCTKRNDFYDFKLEYDVRVPEKSNSGVYLRGRYEVQVLDSYNKKPDCHNMAALYGRITPSKSAEKKPSEWQHVCITLYKRHITVVLNGETIIDCKPVVGVTGGAIDADEFVPGPIYLQGDHSDADFKNMILTKIVK